MANLTSVEWVAKGSSKKNQPHYDTRLVRKLDPIQPELDQTLRVLEASTSDIVDYSSIGKLGITLCNLTSVTKQLLHSDKRGNIDAAAADDLTDELLEAIPLLGLQQSTHLADLDQPLQIYGHNQDKIGLALSAYDPQFYGERAVVEKYVTAHYPEVSSRFNAQPDASWEPHVTIGRVKHENLSRSERTALFDDPSAFLIDRATDTIREENARYGMEQSADIVFPETIMLGGLQVVCQKLQGRIF